MLNQISFAFKRLNWSRSIDVSRIRRRENHGCVRSFKEIPTMSTVSLIKSFLPGGKFYKKDLFELINLLRRDHGDLFYFRGIFGKRSLLFAHNPDDFAKVFWTEGPAPIRHGVNLLKYHRSEYRKEFFQGVEGVITTQGDCWRKFRSAVNPVLMKQENINIYVPQISEVASDFVERIKQIRDPITLEVPEHFIEEMNRWALASISIVALDKQINLFREDQCHADAGNLFINLTSFLRLSYELDIKMSLWKFYPTPKFREAMKSLDAINEIIIKFVNEAVARLHTTTTTTTDRGPRTHESILEKLLKIDKKIATVMAMDMLMTGVDTTSTALTGILLCLARNPEKQETLRREIRQILPNKNSPVAPESGLKNIPYLRACIKEGLRMYPLAVGTMRCTQKDLVLSGYHVPKGTDVTLVMISSLRDPKFFSNPNTFSPERWLPEVAKEKLHPFVNLSFGFGPRSCIGRRIANMELELIIARIIRSFHLEFNHSMEKAFHSFMINIPAIPLKFKFTDVID